MTVVASQRHTREHRCPICDGADGDPRGKGRRCSGFTSTDGTYAHCSREDLAGGIRSNGADLYAHRMRGSCHCGTSHGSAAPIANAIDATYDYRDERGGLLFQVVRKAGKRFLQRRPDGASGWIWKLGDVRRVPYHLPDLADRADTRDVYVVEGERDVETLRGRGLLATCNPGGAGKWSAVAGVARDVLRGRAVVVIADRDDVGRAHARDVAMSLEGVAKSVTAVTPQAPHKDVTDVLLSGGSLADLVPLDSEHTAKTPDDQAARTFAIADHVELARALNHDLGGSDVLTCDELFSWRYDPAAGLWRKFDRSESSRIVQGYSGSPSGLKGNPLRLTASDVAGAIRLATDQIVKPGFFADAPTGIAFANGFVRVTGDDAALESLTRDHRARAGYPFNFERGACPKRFLAFLDGLFRDDDDRHEKVHFVQEFFGACMLGIAPVYQRCVYGIGGGDNGKSRLADVMIAAMPEGTTSAIPPQDFGQEYRRAMLVGMRLNAVGELPERDIMASEAFKAIVSGDPIIGRIIRESPTMFRPIAGHYFAANALPGTSDQTEGFWRRPVVLTFNRSFKSDPTRDPHIHTAIIGDELPALVSWLVNGAVRLLRTGGYTIPPSHHEALAAWRKGSDQVALYLSAETRVLAPDEQIGRCGAPAMDLFERYVRWAVRHGHRPVASNKFGARLKLLGHEPHKTNRGWRYPLWLLTPTEQEERDSDTSDKPVTDSLSLTN